MKPATLKTLRELERNETVTTHDFLMAGCGSRFGARLHELRQAGYRIEEHKLPDRSGSRYRLVSGPEGASHQLSSTQPVEIQTKAHKDLAAAPGETATVPVSVGILSSAVVSPEPQLELFEPVTSMHRYELGEAA